MLVFSWDERFLTGIPVVDEQHQELVRIINQLASMLAEGRDAAQISVIFKKLEDYARMHFATEEDLMAINALPDSLCSGHQEAHQQFVEEILLMKEEAAEDMQRAADSLVRYLISWLTFHILGADRLLGLQLQAVQQGNSPDELVLPQLSDSRTSLLVDALDGMGRVLVSKSRALQQCRSELAQAQERINTLSEDFEARVQARTDELLGVNQALERDCLELKILLQRLAAQGSS